MKVIIESYDWHFDNLRGVVFKDNWELGVSQLFKNSALWPYGSVEIKCNWLLSLFAITFLVGLQSRVTRDVWHWCTCQSYTLPGVFEERMHNRIILPPYCKQGSEISGKHQQLLSLPLVKRKNKWWYSQLHANRIAAPYLSWSQKGRGTAQAQARNVTVFFYLRR